MRVKQRVARVHLQLLMTLQMTVMSTAMGRLHVRCAGETLIVY